MTATVAPPRVFETWTGSGLPVKAVLVGTFVNKLGAFFQTFLDATTSEHVARMVAMKAATDNAEEMAKALSLQYNRARQSQITTELAEIMGGVEAMKG